MMSMTAVVLCLMLSKKQVKSFLLNCPRALSYNNAFIEGDESVVVSHPVHLIGPNRSLAPSALIPFCAFKSDLSMGKPIHKHPNLSFPVCDSFVPDILEGQLCYTLKLKESSGKGKKNGLMLLLDLNKGRSIHVTRDLSPQKKLVVGNKMEMNLDTESSFGDVSAKIQINTMSPHVTYGKGSFKMTSVKRMTATEGFFSLNSNVRNCEVETYDECRTRHLLSTCRCVSWELQ